MHPLEKEILTFIRERELITGRDGTVIVAVSGGPDSICLLHLLARLAGQLHITPVATYVNHGLRPHETDREQQLVRDTAGKLRCSCELGTVDVRGHAVRYHLSIEHAARILRYDFLDAIAERYGADKIALAHTADDQAEELLLRLIRGTGRTGLAGMEAKRQERYIRPLLSTPKSRLLDYLHEFHIAFADDSSNRQPIYLRNKIRLDLIPFLAREFNPNVRQTLLQTAEILREEETLLADIVAKACKTIFVPRDISRETPTPPGNRQVHARVPENLPALTLDLTRFVTYPKAIQRRILEEACWRMQARPSFGQIEQLRRLAGKDGSGARLHLARGLRAMKSANRLIFSYPAGPVSMRGDIESLENAGYFEILIPGPGRWVVEQTGLTVNIDRLATLPHADYKQEPCREYLDLPANFFPLTLRSPRRGDKFHPLGGKGRKKVSDFLIDNKIERQKRWQIPVLVSGDTIIALLGLRIDHHFRITSQTSGVLRVKWRQAEQSHSGASNPVS